MIAKLYMTTVLVAVLLVAGCARKGKSGNYIVEHVPSGKMYYLTGAPLHHPDGPRMGLPGQYSHDFFHFRYGFPPDDVIVRVRINESIVHNPDGSTYNPARHYPNSITAKEGD